MKMSTPPKRRLATRWLLTFTVCLLALPGMSRVWRVTTTGASSSSAGLDWNTPAALIYALDNAGSGDEIWVKTGSYFYRDNHSFQLRTGVRVYGGFAGLSSETSTSSRSSNKDLNPVIISNRTNTTEGTTNSDMPVFIIEQSNGTLDRITFSNAYTSQNSGSLGLGAAIRMESVMGITITDAKFINCYAQYDGGAVYMYNSTASFTGCTFTGCRSLNGTSGAMWVRENSRATIDTCTFTSNSCQYEGGAILLSGGSSGGKLTVTRSTFTSNSTVRQGGAIGLLNTSEASTFSKVVFETNRSGSATTAYNETGHGGGLYCLGANYTMTNCVFFDNKASGNGGAIFNTQGLTSTTDYQPAITNVLFLSNGTPKGNAGAIGNERTSSRTVNCTFVDNYFGSGVGSGAGGIYTYATTGATVFGIPTATVQNSIFKRNGFAGTGGVSSFIDIKAQSPGTSTTSYSCYIEVQPPVSSGNFNSSEAPTPFINGAGSAAASKGPDGKWMTADDGFYPSFCTTTLIDRGSNTGAPTDKDLGGQARRFNVPLVSDEGVGPGDVIDIGAYESQNAASATSVAGTIGNPHAIPYPQELFTDYITNITSPSAAISIRWEMQDALSGTWSPAVPASTDLEYRIPELTRTTSFRRVAQSSTYCNAYFASNPVEIKVVNPPDGAISGKVVSKNGTGVQGIVITVTRQAAIPGSPAGYTYRDTTDIGGGYSVDPIFYGDRTAGNVSSSFTITPSKQGHGFKYNNSPVTSISLTLTSSRPKLDNIFFEDTTVLTITGKTYQECTSCLTPVSKVCPIDSVPIYKDGSYTTISGYIDTAFGRYVVPVIDPSPTTIEPRLTGHRFDPVFRTITPISNIRDADFKDTTTHLISGKLTAGCDNYIGTAELEFYDVLPNAPNGSVRSSCFTRRVTTTPGSGIYSIRLPARKYRVRVVSFTSAGGRYPVIGDSVISFINGKVPADSLTRDISLKDTTLNIVYVRPPVVSITGLPVVCLTPAGTPYARLRQATTDSFKVFVYQGDSALGCPLSDTVNKIRVMTNVQQEDQLETIQYAVADTGTRIRLTGGTPNITGNYLKDLFVYFTDRYGRTVPSFNRKVLVTGVKADTGKTFTTVSPEVPLVVLHDPPGDASYSTWQQSRSISNAVRFYAGAGIGVERWAEVKVGVETTVGIGVAVDAKAWGLIRGSIGVNAKATYTNEAILTTTTTQNFSTSGNPEVTGNNGDVYIGAALNLIYTTATVIGFDGCTVTTKRQLIMANSGFKTNYIYSEDYILNTLIPNLQGLAQIEPNDSTKRRYLSQISVWQQVVDNNTANKRRAAFVQNYSFDGSAGPYTNTTTTSSSKSSSIEFGLDIEASVASELGFEIAGSGASTGGSVSFRLEVGGSETNTTTDETTIGYTLDDNTPGDFFSVNVKKDPVYNTPVFELAAGTASCPTEPGAQPRDAVFFTATNPVAQGINPANPATFNLKIVNTSPSTSTNANDKRTYKLGYVQSSNVANETITIAGTPYNSNSPYISRPLGYLDSVIVPVSITRQAGSLVYSYEGETFTVSSSCDEDLGKTVAVSAYFASPCSSINLAQPVDGWVVNNTSSNRIFIKPTGYDLSALTSVNVQFSNGSTWTDGPYLNATQLASGTFFDVSTLPDGVYGIRLRLDCSSGTVYSQRATGLIDRRPPQLFGRPDPTDNNYINGDAIGISYDEMLNRNGNILRITMRRLSTNDTIPVTASIYNNKISIVPSANIAAFNGDSMYVIISGVRDSAGNVRATLDTISFTIGTSVPATGNRALSMYVVNPTVYKNNDTGVIRIYFILPANATVDTRVNYTIGGTARYNVDYSASYPTTDALYASFNGSTGSIRIPQGQRQAILTLKPIAGDTALNANKTIIIRAVEGGDYALGTPTSVMATLTTEDGINVYTFTGDGNWNIRNNWANGKMPLTTLIAPKEIVINPSGTCVLNVEQTIKPGAKITVKQNRRFLILGNLKINQNP